MKLVVFNGFVHALHANNQNLTGLYPGCDVLIVPDETSVGIDDPWDIDLDALKAAKIEEAKAACEAVLDPLGAEYGRWETATWDQQVAEATAIMADPLAPVPMLTAMAAARGMEVAALAQRILVNREAWSAISGAVIGQRQAIYDQVKAADTVAAVNSIVVNITLPT